MRDNQSTLVKRGLELFEDFTGHAGEVCGTVELPEDEVLTVIGPCEAIAYTATRDGKTYSFQHEFEDPKCRPLLAASVDGTRLYLIGGSFKFGSRGIEDN